MYIRTGGGERMNKREGGVLDLSSLGSLDSQLGGHNLSLWWSSHFGGRMDLPSRYITGRRTTPKCVCIYARQQERGLAKHQHSYNELFIFLLYCCQMSIMAYIYIHIYGGQSIDLYYLVPDGPNPGQTVCTNPCSYMYNTYTVHIFKWQIERESSSAFCLQCKQLSSLWSAGLGLYRKMPPPPPPYFFVEKKNMALSWLYFLMRTWRLLTRCVFEVLFIKKKKKGLSNNRKWFSWCQFF